jgi:hypothetical protein
VAPSPCPLPQPNPAIAAADSAVTGASIAVPSPRRRSPRPRPCRPQRLALPLPRSLPTFGLLRKAAGPHADIEARSHCRRLGLRGGRGSIRVRLVPSLFSWPCSLRPDSQHAECCCLVACTSRARLERAGVWLLVRDKSHEIKNIKKLCL